MCKTQKATRAIISLAIGWLVAVGFTTSDAHGEGASFTAKPSEAVMKKHLNWMAKAPDQVLLSALSLPGTHDTCALHNGPSFGFAQCQTWRLEDQLKAGVRFLDIRCRHIDNAFQIHHGVIDQRITFVEVRDICRKFLKEHPSECIVMSVKEESTAKNNTRSFAKTFVELTKNDGDLWRINRKTPTLGDARKRIVLIDRTGALGGLPWNRIERQDQYTAPLDRKRKLVRKHFEQAIGGDKERWFANFCSGVLPSSLVTPRRYAMQSNEAALQFLLRKERGQPMRLGIVVMDFPGEKLLERIVATNFERDGK